MFPGSKEVLRVAQKNWDEKKEMKGWGFIYPSLRNTARVNFYSIGPSAFSLSLSIQNKFFLSILHFFQLKGKK